MFTEHSDLELLWIGALGANAITRFLVWRADRAFWQTYSTADYVTVHEGEHHLLIRALRVDTLLGFEQRLRLPGPNGGIINLTPFPVLSEASELSVAPAPSASSYDAAIDVDDERVDASPPSSPAPYSATSELMQPSADEDNLSRPSRTMRSPRPIPPSNERSGDVETRSERSPSRRPGTAHDAVPYHRTQSRSQSPAIEHGLTPPPSTQPRRAIVTPERSPTPGVSSGSGQSLTQVLLRAQSRLRAQARVNEQPKPYRSVRMRPGRRPRASYLPEIIDLTGDTDAEGEDCDFIDLTAPS